MAQIQLLFLQDHTSKILDKGTNLDGYPEKPNTTLSKESNPLGGSQKWEGPQDNGKENGNYYRV